MNGNTTPTTDVWSIIESVAGRKKAVEAAITSGFGPGHNLMYDYAFVTKDSHRRPSLGYAQLNALDAGDLAQANRWDPVRFTVSVLTDDRDGDMVVPKGIVTTNYAKNPVWFFGHQSLAIPIGLCRPVGRRSKAYDPTVPIGFYRDDARAQADWYCDHEDPDADFIWSKCVRGLLSATSIAFVPLDAVRRDYEEKAIPRSSPMLPPGWRFLSSDLTEISIVGVPSCADAVRDIYDREKSFMSPRLQKGWLPYCAEAKGCWNGWCPCPAGEDCTPCKEAPPAVKSDETRGGDVRAVVKGQTSRFVLPNPRSGDELGRMWQATDGKWYWEVGGYKYHYGGYDNRADAEHAVVEITGHRPVFKASRYPVRGRYAKGDDMKKKCGCKACKADKPCPCAKMSSSVQADSEGTSKPYRDVIDVQGDEGGTVKPKRDKDGKKPKNPKETKGAAGKKALGGISGSSGGYTLPIGAIQDEDMDGRDEAGKKKPGAKAGDPKRQVTKEDTCPECGGELADGKCACGYKKTVRAQRRKAENDTRPPDYRGSMKRADGGTMGAQTDEDTDDAAEEVMSRPGADFLAKGIAHLKEMDDWATGELGGQEPEIGEAFADAHEALRTLIQMLSDKFGERYADQDLDKMLKDLAGPDPESEPDVNLEGEEGMVDEGDVPPDPEAPEDVEEMDLDTSDGDDLADADVDPSDDVNADADEAGAEEVGGDFNPGEGDAEPVDLESDTQESTEEILERYRKPMTTMSNKNSTVKRAPQRRKQGTDLVAGGDKPPDMDEDSGGDGLGPAAKSLLRASSGLANIAKTLARVAKDLSERGPIMADDPTADRGGSDLDDRGPGMADDMTTDPGGGDLGDYGNTKLQQPGTGRAAQVSEGADGGAPLGPMAKRRKGDPWGPQSPNEPKPPTKPDDTGDDWGPSGSASRKGDVNALDPDPQGDDALGPMAKGDDQDDAASAVGSMLPMMLEDDDDVEKCPMVKGRPTLSRDDVRKWLARFRQTTGKLPSEMLAERGAHN